MCGRKSKTLLVLSVLLCSSLVLPLSASLSADVRLTDEEANQLMTEIQESKKELQTVKEELSDVKNTCNEQKIYYEEQLSEADKENHNLKTVVTVTTTTTVCSVLIILGLLLFL